ncbi:MAG: hypothetical protein ACR2LL_10465 [Nitrosopumilus sp.]|uniref:hypothetical protein n=1 Tax=Nitrosopumilus sp. TaxID=2024843 RepID=UPI002931B13A|nr:hypothetical protein [Nitrosopumilus sp.]
MGRRCIGICVRYKSTSISNGLKYKLGQKRCSYCGLFMDTENVRCPCCKVILRTKPRNKTTTIL